MESFPTLNFASSTRVDTTSTTSLRTSALTFPSNNPRSPRISLGNPVTCYKGSRAMADSVFPPGVSALRTFDSRPRQRLRDLIEDEGLGGFLLPRPGDLRRRGVFPGERALVPARIAVQLPLHRKHEGATLRTEHEALGETKGTRDKKGCVQRQSFA